MELISSPKRASGASLSRSAGVRRITALRALMRTHPRDAARAHPPCSAVAGGALGSFGTVGRALSNKSLQRKSPLRFSINVIDMIGSRKGLSRLPAT
jgi:hypothetical protein